MKNIPQSDRVFPAWRKEEAICRFLMSKPASTRDGLVFTFMEEAVLRLLAPAGRLDILYLLRLVARAVQALRAGMSFEHFHYQEMQDR